MKSAIITVSRKIEPALKIFKPAISYSNKRLSLCSDKELFVAHHQPSAGVIKALLRLKAI
ncbi:MAG: hypothetical protein JST85_22615 [Acidobacteria bacterium]|nr:hypothetical protein [Acidobacteriota bacterium]